ncbi:hypothetical protein L1077_05215 [Pseudoalteromonas luteoviolacea]|uniref:hypothetical protein n=1 Tax=Pseudoalteromonas luteoviolacea TaxID=43657 RepID=UPI001F1B0F01|nr:hypothetical protein [Pseudoalteromonas luteoviolacea]MCF6438829.1 hypothetical protein [Pseudoalteromonas luteoviolacea]
MKLKLKKNKIKQLCQDHAVLNGKATKKVNGGDNWGGTWHCPVTHRDLCGTNWAECAP